MKYNPEIHHRRSIRLKEYDYSQAGAYFITLCIQQKVCLFGTIVDEKMILNSAGKRVDHWWNELKNKYGNIELGEYIIMPNHFHGIIIVGANLCVRPDNLRPEINNQIKNMEQTHRSAPTVGEMIQWFKTMTTNEYIRNVKQNGWEPFSGKLWQRNYYEHIIRNDKSLENISEYIVYNSNNWAKDDLFVT